MTSAAFTQGQQVVHGTKPEWGIGEVLRTTTTTQEGKACQRLTIKFDRVGTKVVSTAFAKIETAEKAVERATGFAQSGSWLDSANPEATRQAMATLPEAAVDPFSSLEARFAATCDLYRFSDHGGSLVDWAAAQTGLADPLSAFNRTELERFFEKYRLKRDEHLRDVASELRRKNPAALERALSTAPDVAQAVLRNGNGRR